MVKEGINFTVHGETGGRVIADDPEGGYTHMSDHTETVLDGPTADSGSREWPTETVPDGPTADSGSREWTQRFLSFGLLTVCAIAEIAWLIVLAWATLSFARWLFS
jgi:hypothetical protein